MAMVVRPVAKPETNSYIWLQTVDGSIQQVEAEVAMFCPMICQEILIKTSGYSKSNAIKLPDRVNPSSLGLILDYCRFHRQPGHSNKERKAFDEKFIRLNTKKLCELTSAADSLQFQPLIELTSRTLARMIEGRSAEEIRDVFNLPDDLTEEEKLEPVNNVSDDPRIRLLNRLHAKKRKELKEREKKTIVTPEEHVDERSVDDLLSFINGEDKDSKSSKAGKSKKKNHKKKEHLKVSELNNENGTVGKKCEATAASSENGDHADNSAPISPLKSQDPVSEPLFPISDFDDEDLDDGMDPEFKAQVDREVEDFARILNSDWSQRVRELLSIGQDRRDVPVWTRGSSSVQGYSNKSPQRLTW